MSGPGEPMSESRLSQMGTTTQTRPANGQPRLRTVLDEIPANPEAEKALLASLFALPEAMDRPDVAAVRPGDFLDTAHQTIFRHIVDARHEGQSPEALPS